MVLSPKIMAWLSAYLGQARLWIISFGYLWESLDLKKAVSFACSLKMPLKSMMLFSTTSNTYRLSQLKTDKIFKRILSSSMVKADQKLEAYIQSLIGILF